MFKKHTKVFKMRQERAEIQYKDGRRQSPDYSFWDYVKDEMNGREW